MEPTYVGGYGITSMSDETLGLLQATG